MDYIFLLPPIPNSFFKTYFGLKKNLEYSLFNHAHLHVCIKRAQITWPVWLNWTSTEYYWCILIWVWLILFKGSLYLGAKHTFTCIFCLLPAYDRTFCRNITLSDALHLVFPYTISCDSPLLTFVAIYQELRSTIFMQWMTFNIRLLHAIFDGTRWRSWLRHRVTSQKVAGSIPDGVIGIFHWHNPSGCTMDLGLTHPLTEMSTRNISWGVKEAGA
jgi:hypothetical protein